MLVATPLIIPRAGAQRAAATGGVRRAKRWVRFYRSARSGGEVVTSLLLDRFMPVNGLYARHLAMRGLLERGDCSHSLAATQDEPLLLKGDNFHEDRCEGLPIALALLTCAERQRRGCDLRDGGIWTRR